MFLFFKRTIKTSEIIISRLFPSGCGWYSGSLIAEKLDYTIFEPNFFLITGLSQSIFVMSGHILYSKFKLQFSKNNNYENINMKNEKHKALQIGTATFLSGSIWQPTVNLLENSDFIIVSTITGTICGLSFLSGLLLTRSFFHLLHIDIEKNSKNTIKKDIGVSTSIGGATGLSVSTDTSINNNYMIDYFGITSELTINEAIITAGLSNACGFLALQTLQNMQRKTWLD